MHRAVQGLLVCAALACGVEEAGSSSPTAMRTEPPVERVAEPSEPPPDPEQRLADPVPAPDPTPPCALPTSPLAGSPTFAVQFGEELTSLPLMSAFLMPGETLPVQAALGDREARFAARADGGTLEPLGPGRWAWTAPATPGTHCLVVRDGSSGESIRLRLFVLTPYDGSETFRGYRIGRYRREPLRGDPAYRVPRGLVEVSEADRELRVSPHFQLHQFICKQESGSRVYLVLTTRLIAKLERLLAAFRDRGIDADTLFVMSGYRTPWYNQRIGNRTSYTRHAYGDAADVFVDRDRDGHMDDLDGDGAVDASDARVLYDIVEGMRDEPWYRPYVGGLAVYGPKPHRGPFVHVDTRGSVARW